MSDIFKASNGDKIRLDGVGDFEILDSVGSTKNYVFEQSFQALREFFLHELGLWQDPEQPHILVMRLPEVPKYKERSLGIIDTQNKSLYAIEENYGADKFKGIIERYFAAHPEPKPWHEAKPGEAWLLTVNMIEEVVEGPYIVDSEECFDNPELEISITSPSILDGRRIYSPTEEA